jgi:nitrite reductase/ring-hydroxylating ferredoxin subunit
MGELLRRYWMPAVLSSELPAPDCPPVRVRLLGEDLVAFRDSHGRVGLLAEKCSHRRASLFYGRTEDGGLRCVYHGWHYDVAGNICDTPAEPAESMIKHHVKHLAYPCREVNGLIYTYMGPRAEMPLLPELPWLTLPADHVRLSGKIINDCNWLQTQEGNLDSVHAAYLHSSARFTADLKNRYRNRNNPPKFLVEQARWGVRAIACYPAEDGAYFIRTNTFVMPCYGAIPTGNSIEGKLDGYNVNIEVPADDYTTVRYNVAIQRSLPIDLPEDRPGGRGGRGALTTPDGRKLRNRINDYLIDREKQRSDVLYSGIEGVPIQDAAMVETMGPISDRTNEHLGITDTQVAAVRMFLLGAVESFRQGAAPPGLAWSGADDNSYADLYLVDALIPAGRDWKEMVPEVTTHAVS